MFCPSLLLFYFLALLLLTFCYPIRCCKKKKKEREPTKKKESFSPREHFSHKKKRDKTIFFFLFCFPFPFFSSRSFVKKNPSLTKTRNKNFLPIRIVRCAISYFFVCVSVCVCENKSWSRVIVLCTWKKNILKFQKKKNKQTYAHQQIRLIKRTNLGHIKRYCGLPSLFFFLIYSFFIGKLDSLLV